jgi:hypothetical protein
MNRTSRRRLIFVAIVVISWTAATGWLLVREAFPGLFNEVGGGGYRSWLGHGLLVADDWMKITFQGKRIGYSHTTVDSNEAEPLAHYRIGNRTVLQMNLMGTRQNVSVNTEAAVDVLYNLQNFVFTLSASGYTMDIRGRRRKGDVFDITVRGAGSMQRLQIRIPDDTVLYSPMTEMALRALKPGKQLTLRTFNPVTLSPQSIIVRSLRKEPFKAIDREVTATVLSASVDGMETLSWMDPDGKLLRQETTFGWVMEACTPQEAFISAGKGGDQDLLTAMAVPVSGRIDLLSGARKACLRLTGIDLPKETIESQRQTVLSVSNGTMDVEVRTDTPPPAGLAPGPLDPEFAPYLANTPFLQTTDSRMYARARSVAGNWTNSLEAATALYDWVHRRVDKKSTVSLPSALDVLLRMEGDCNEHTYLFVALARAIGIPAKIRVGLTLHEGLFYYHAWPSVYVGRWLDMDPTLGKPAVDTGYLSLFEGELAEQVRLMGVLGRLKVEVLQGKEQP